MNGTKSNTEIVSVSFPKELVQAMHTAVKQEKRSRSKIVQEAVRRYLWSQNFQSIQQYGYEQALKNKISEKDVSRLIHEYRKEQ